MKYRLSAKAHDKIIISLFSIALLIILIFGSFNMMIFNKEFYQKEYRKNGVYLQFSDDRDIAFEKTENITSNIMKYFRNSEELGYFTQSEKDHMADVKKIVRSMQFIYYSAAALSIILFFYCYRKFKDDKHEFTKVLSKTLLYSSIASMILLVVMFLLCVFYFDITFTVFHMIFFPQGNWTFDSSSLLITLFPQQFFFDIALRIFIYAMFQSLIFFGIGYWMRKQLKMFERHHN